MANKFVIAVKENKNQIRQKLIVTGVLIAGITVSAVALYRSASTNGVSDLNPLDTVADLAPEIPVN